MNRRTKWIGLDIQEGNIEVAVLDDDQPPSQAVTVAIDNEIASICRLMEELRQDTTDLRACYEAGPRGFEMQRMLTKMDIQCEVIAPARVHEFADRGSKPQHRDALKLVRQYRGGRLSAISVPDENRESLRDLVRAREAVVREVLMARLEMMKFLIRRGRVYRKASYWSPEHHAWLGKQTFEHPRTQSAFDYSLTHMEYLETRQADLESDILSVAGHEPYRSVVRRLMSLRGGTVFSAMSLIVEL